MTRLEKAAELGFETSLDGALDEPFDVVVDCSGREGGIAFCLRSARRGGQLVQIGLAGRPVTVPFDEICYRELTVTGGNASTSASWRRALALLEAGAVDLGTLVTEVVPLAEWERAFSGHPRRPRDQVRARPERAGYLRYGRSTSRASRKPRLTSSSVRSNDRSSCSIETT